MQFLLMVYANEEHFETVPNSAKRRVSDACDVWHEKLKQSGHARGMERLHPVETATTVRRSSDRFLVTDGPFAETKEVLGGFALVECRDREEALELAKTFPVLDIGMAVEVRRIMTPEDDKQRWGDA
jgi:hypothetical protein